MSCDIRQLRNPIEARFIYENTSVPISGGVHGLCGWPPFFFHPRGTIRVEVKL